MREWLRRPDARLWIAWAQFWIACAGLPLSLIFTDEPPFILALSWWAIIATSYDIICTTELKEQG